MSDEINYKLVGAWSTMALFQFGSVIIDLWKLWRRRRRALTGYEKVLRGESVNGWRMAVSISNFCKRHARGLTNFVKPPWPSKESDGDVSTNIDPFSLLFMTTHQMPDGRRSSFLCRYSLIADVSFDILQIIFDDDQWQYTETSYYITDRIVAVVFRKTDNGQYRLVLVNVIKKSYRFITIESPVENADVVAVARGDTKKNQLNVIFWMASQANNIDDDAPPTWRLEFFDVPYEIPPSGNVETPIRSSVWHSISISMGHRLQIRWHLELPAPMIVLFDPDNIENIDDHRLVSFDQNEGWSIQSLGDWLASMRNSKLMNAAESFGLLNPPNDPFWSQLPPLRYLPWIRSGHPPNSALIYFTEGGGILQRSTRPTTLKRVAAESFCKANPKAQFSNMKKVIGFDIFDGMLDEDDRDLPLVRF